MLGNPSISIPMLKGEDSLPIGIQIIAPREKDHFLLQSTKELLPIS